jgi:hypothetical protein
MASARAVGGGVRRHRWRLPPAPPARAHLQVPDLVALDAEALQRTAAGQPLQVLREPRQGHPHLQWTRTRGCRNALNGPQGHITRQRAEWVRQWENQGEANEGAPLGKPSKPSGHLSYMFPDVTKT